MVEYVGGLNKDRRKCIRCGIILCAKNSGTTTLKRHTTTCRKRSAKELSNQSLVDFVRLPKRESIVFLHHMAGKDEALGFAIESVLGKWLNQNSVVNAIVNGHGEFYDKMKSLSEITPIADDHDHGYSVQPTLDFDAFNVDDDKQSFDIDVAMKSFRPTSADPERFFSLTRISRNFLQNRMLPENQARNAFWNKNCYLFN